MIPGSLARRYARALLQLAESPTERDRLATDMSRFSELVRERDADGMIVLQHLDAGRFPLAQRKRLLEALVLRAGLHTKLTRFLVYVLERGRFRGVPQMARAAMDLADTAANRVRARVTSARPLDSDVIVRLRSSLERATAKTVVLETSVDSELIGGLVATIGGYVLDGSVRTTLANLRSSLHGS